MSRMRLVSLREQSLTRLIVKTEMTPLHYAAYNNRTAALWALLRYCLLITILLSSLSLQNPMLLLLSFSSVSSSFYRRESTPTNSLPLVQGVERRSLFETTLTSRHWSLRASITSSRSCLCWKGRQLLSLLPSYSLPDHLSWGNEGAMSQWEQRYGDMFRRSHDPVNFNPLIRSV